MNDRTVWRSLLFVPADAQGLLARAHLRGADGLILDLEDGVAAPAKEAARRNLPTSLRGLANKGVDLLVRINNTWRMALADLEVAACASVSALVVPKVEDPARLGVISEILEEFEAERGLSSGQIGLVALVESPLGLARAPQIAAVPRVTALALGPEDFCLELGVTPTQNALNLPCRQLALAASTRGLQCLAMPISIAVVEDMESFGAAADEAAAVGCTGALCVHPSQVKVANVHFGPSAQELLHAQAVIEEWTRAQAAGQAVVKLNGFMIDRPVAERAMRALKQRGGL